MDMQAWSEGLADVLSPSARNLPPLAQLVAAEDMKNAGAIAMALPLAQVDRYSFSRCAAQRYHDQKVVRSMMPNSAHF